MLKTYIFNESKSNWTEEDQRLLLHDVCVFLDETNKKIYLWNGPKSSKEKSKKGHELIGEILSNYPNLDLQLVVLKKDIPTNIEKKLKSMLNYAKNEKIEPLFFSRLSTIRFYFIFLLGVIIFPIVLFTNLSLSLLWPVSNGNYEVSNTLYEMWINISKILITITIFLFVFNIIIGIIELETQVIIISTIGLIISIGIILYLNFGIFLFLFQEGSTLNNYLISREDLFFFLSLNLIAILIFEIPNIYKFVSFLKTYRKFIM
ncbi:MAG: hypothetical protein ACFFB0_00275 [Promethearchaeota archaeon]